MTTTEIVIEFDGQFDDRARFESGNLEKMLNFEKKEKYSPFENRCFRQKDKVYLRQQPTLSAKSLLGALI